MSLLGIKNPTPGLRGSLPSEEKEQHQGMAGKIGVLYRKPRAGARLGWSTEGIRATLRDVLSHTVVIQSLSQHSQL